MKSLAKRCLGADPVSQEPDLARGMNRWARSFVDASNVRIGKAVFKTRLELYELALALYAEALDNEGFLNRGTARKIVEMHRQYLEADS